jgi:hypothetical protein
MYENGIGGFMWGVVVDNYNPERPGLHEIRWRREGVFEPYHPHWALPIGWAGASQPADGANLVGSRPKPPAIGSQVAVIFEHGDVAAPAVYLAGPYGQASDGRPAWPGIDRELLDPAVDDAVDIRDVHVVWEDDTFRIFVVNSAAGNGDKRVVLMEKLTGSGLVLNATDGAQGKSITLTLTANTGINIQSNGIINIASPTGVQIQGRRVMRKPGVTTI